MTFDAGTWWLITIIVTTVVGLVGFLFGRSVFRQLDENRATSSRCGKITHRATITRRTWNGCARHTKKTLKRCAVK